MNSLNPIRPLRRIALAGCAALATWVQAAWINELADPAFSAAPAEATAPATRGDATTAAWRARPAPSATTG
jgi:hypothetical protein